MINERTYGADCARGELRLSLLRSPAYAAHPILDRPILPEDRYSPRNDQGERLFHFWLQGGPAAERLAAVDREALAHNEKPMALSFFPRGGGSAVDGQGPRLSDAAVQLTALEEGRRRGRAGAAPVRAHRAGARDARGAALCWRILYRSAGRVRSPHPRFDPAHGAWTQVNLMEEPL